MANTKNLKRGNPATQFKAGDRRAVEAGKRGREKQLKSDERTRSLRDAAFRVLNGSYPIKNKITGETDDVSGYDRMFLVTFKIATDPGDKQCIAAQRFIYELLAEDKRTPEQIEKDKAEVELIRAKIKAYAGDNVDIENEIPELYKALGATDNDIL